MYRNSFMSREGRPSGFKRLFALCAAVSLMLICLTPALSAQSEAASGYVLTVDGRAAGWAASSEELRAAVASAISRYGDDAVLLSEVEIVPSDAGGAGFSADIPLTAFLDPENADSPVRLRVETSRDVSEFRTIHPGTQYIYDDTMYESESTVIREGSDGIRRLDYSETTTDGDTARTLLDNEITKPAVNTLIAVGTKPGVRTESTGTYLWPTQGIISSYFGPRSGSVGSSNHKGLDIAGEYGTPVCAADGGEIIFAERADGYGLFIKILHDNGDISCYAHLSKILVGVGARVAQGSSIGLMGSTGTSSGTHLHFEVRRGGTEHVDPLECIAAVG